MKRFKACFMAALAVLSVFSLLGCQKEEKGETHTGFAFDTVYDFRTYGSTELQQSDVQKKLTSLTSALSVIDEGAILKDFNSSKDLTLTVEDGDLSACLSEAFLYAALTDGAFDLTLGSLRELWNIAGDSALLPTDEQIEKALKNSGFSRASFDADKGALTRENPHVYFDLGAIAKGYVAELFADLYRSSGAEGGVLDFGGTVTVFGQKPSKEPFKIGIRSPYGQADSYAGYLTLSPEENKSLTVSVSGLYERYREVGGVVYTHIFDPESGYPLPADTSDPNDLLSAAVLSENGAMADAFSTALLVMGREKAQDFCARYSEELGFSALLFAADGNVIECGTLDYQEITNSD